MEALVILLFIGMAIVMYFVRAESHSEKIGAYVESLGGILIEFDTAGLFKGGLGPFMVVGKGRVVYHVIYKINNEKREGWVRFGGIGGPDWRF